LSRCASASKELREMAAENQSGPPSIDHRQPILDPVPHSVAMNVESAGSLLDRIAAESFDPVAALHLAPAPGYLFALTVGNDSSQRVSSVASRTVRLPTLRADRSPALMAA